MRTLRKVSSLAAIALLAASLNIVHAQTNSGALIAVEATAMNVLYLGVNNPVNIAVAGYESSEISVKVSQGMIEGSNGIYEVKPGKAGKLSFDVYAGEKHLGSKVFRVLTVPDPAAVLRNADGTIAMKGPKAKMNIQQAAQVKSLGADLNDFLFDVHFKVISFQMSVNIDGIAKVLTSDAAEFTREMQQQIRSARPGQVFVFEDIKAIGPDGKTRKLQAIEVKIM